MTTQTLIASAVATISFAISTETTFALTFCVSNSHQYRKGFESFSRSRRQKTALSRCSASRRCYLEGSLAAAGSAFLWEQLRLHSVQALELSSEETVSKYEGPERMVFAKRPRAPTAALLPAIQQRLVLETCLSICSTIATSADAQSQEAAMRKLKDLMLDPSVTEKSEKLPSFSSVTSKKQSLLDRQIMLQYSPDRVVGGGLVRACMNIYTANLRYNTDDSSYIVTDPEWKKQYIRSNDGLPDVTRVITADLDIRDLYRNQVQLKVDDAAAELYLANPPDMEEFQSLLKEAIAAMDQWFERIPDADVEEALNEARKGKSLQVYESYRAGFIPPPSSR